MNYKHLIDASKIHLGKYPGAIAVSGAAGGAVKIFPSGARWLFDRLNELDGKNDRVFNTTISYNFYGGLKYGVCLAGTALLFLWGLHYSYWCIPLAILFFYVLEIHFLFLFPLLIDNSKQPLLTGIRSAYRLGLFHCLFTVIPIAIFMLLGLLRRSDPFRNWYIGCLAILIWYNNEAKNKPEL